MFTRSGPSMNRAPGESDFHPLRCDLVVNAKHRSRCFVPGEKRTFYFFGGLPRGRTVDCSPNRRAASSVHAAPRDCACSPTDVVSDQTIQNAAAARLDDGFANGSVGLHPRLSSFGRCAARKLEQSTGFRLLTAGKLRDASPGRKTPGRDASGTRDRRQATGHRLQASGFRLQASGFRPQVRGERGERGEPPSRLTSCLSPLAPGLFLGRKMAR